jgi:anti-anti-sigma regulatory factor
MMTLSKDKGPGFLRISGNLDIDEADSLREALLAADLRELDLSEVEACDAAGLQVLLAAAGKSFQITAISNAVTQMAVVLGVSLEEKDHPHAS